MIKGYSTCPNCGAEVTTYFTDEALSDHDKQIRDEIVAEMRKQLDIKIDFGGLENKLLFFDNYDKIAEQMKGEQNEN